MRRSIIRIDAELCTGCGDCIPNCPEGAIQIIDGKARLVSDLFCDGLGACIGHCPEGAIAVEERDAEPYDERKVMENIVRQGPNVVAAHLAHLREHGATDYLAAAIEFLHERNIPVPGPRSDIIAHIDTVHGGTCPGTESRSFRLPAPRPLRQEAAKPGEPESPAPAELSSALTHWPIQLHLVSAAAPHYRGADLVLAADCVAFALPSFQRDFLRGKKLAIACPKLDQGREVYLRKLVALVDEARIQSLHVMIMQVPCCGGLLRLAQEAVAQADRDVPITCTVVGIQGDILADGPVGG